MVRVKFWNSVRVYIVSSKKKDFFFSHISSEKLCDMQAVARN